MSLRLGGSNFETRVSQSFEFTIIPLKVGPIKTVTFGVFEIRDSVFDYRRDSCNVINRDDQYLHIRTTMIKVLLPEICCTLLLLLELLRVFR